MFKIDIDNDFQLELLHLSQSADLFAATKRNREYLREWLPWLDEARTEADTRNFIRSTMKQYADNLGFQTALVYQEHIIGITGYHPLNKANRSGCIGYWLDRHYQGKGLMTKAVSKIIEIGFRQWGLDKIVITCARENNKSRSIAERLGFKLDGILRQNEWLYDHYVDSAVYSLLKLEFELQKAADDIRLVSQCDST